VWEERREECPMRHVRPINLLDIDPPPAGRPTARNGPEVLFGLCRKVAFWRQNPKMGSRKINDLGASTFLFSVICDRAA
jgi:hypothetical protein